ncbi:MAG: hypothetical protein WD992_01765 [Candidatus Levyibacteriota bacterium]
MSPDIRPGTTIEISRGELVLKTLGIATQALLETYPQLDKSPYKKRLIAPHNIKFEPFDNIVAREMEDRPMDNSILCQALSLCGIPKDYVSARWFRVRDDQPFYQRSPDDPLFLAQEYVPHLSTNGPLQGRDIVALGDLLIVKSIENSPTQRHLTLSPWKEIMRKTLDGFWPNIVREQGENIDKIRLEQAKDMVRSLFDSRVNITAIGASVYVIFEGQTVSAFEFVGGHQLSRNTVGIIADTPRVKFRTMMRESGLIGKEGYPINHSRSRDDSERLLNSITSRNLKNRADFLRAHLESTIPTYYITSKKKGSVDPEKYPY